jgi:hypothetical protein
MIVYVGLLAHQESLAKRRRSTFSMVIQNHSIAGDSHFCLYPSFSMTADIFCLESLLEPNLTSNSFSVLRCFPIASVFDPLAMLVNVSDRQRQKSHRSRAKTNRQKSLKTEKFTHLCEFKPAADDQDDHICSRIVRLTEKAKFRLSHLQEKSTHRAHTLITSFLLRVTF